MSFLIGLVIVLVIVLIILRYQGTKARRNRRR